MKRCILVLAAALAPVLLHAQPALFPMVEDDRWGYIDETGHWVIAPTFFWARSFHEGLAAVTDDGNCWRFIDTSGETAFERAFCAYDGWAMVMDGGRSLQEATDWYSEGLVPVLHQGSVAYADTEGQIAIEGGFTAAYPFADGRGRVRTADGTWGFVDAAGALAIPAEYTEARDFSEGLAAAAAAGEDGRARWGYIDVDGVWAVEPRFLSAESFSEGLAAVTFLTEDDDAAQRSGYVDSSGEIVIEHSFGSAGAFGDGLAPVRYSYYGYLDRSGQAVIAAVYENAHPFSEGLAAVEDGAGWHFITPDGRRAFEHPMLAEVIRLEPFQNGLARAVFSLPEAGYSLFGSDDMTVVSGAYFGYFDRNGELVAVQSEEERERIIARIRAEEEEKAADERRQEEEQAQWQAEILADCPDEIVYGDPAHADMLEFSLAGKVRRLHFETIEVEEAEPGRFHVVVPRIMTQPERSTGWINAHPASAAAPLATGSGSGYGGIGMTLQPGATFSSSRLSLRNMQLPRLDCLQRAPGFAPGDLFDSWKSNITITVEPDAAGAWLVVESQARASDLALRLSVTSPPVVPAGDPGERAERYLGDEAFQARAMVAPSLHAAYVSPLARQDEEGYFRQRSAFMVPLPASGSRVAQVGSGQVTVYEFVVLEDDLLVIDQHTVSLQDSERTADAIIRVPSMAPPPLDELELTAETLVDRFVATRVARRELPVLTVDVGDRPPEPARLGFHELPSSAPALPLRQLQPYGTRVGLGERILSYSLRDTTVDGRAMLALSVVERDASQMAIRQVESALAERLGEDGLDALISLMIGLQQWEEEPTGDEIEAFREWFDPLLLRIVPEAQTAGMAPEEAFEVLMETVGEAALYATEQLAAARMIEESAEQFALLDAFFEALDEVREDASRIGAVRGLLAELGVDPPETDDPVQYIDAAMVGVYDAHHQVLMLHSQTRMFSSPDRTIAEVHVDPASGLPLARLARSGSPGSELAVELSVRFAGSEMRMAAENEAQGRDAVRLPLPHGAVDALQLLTLVPFLELAAGAEVEMYLVDVAESTTHSFSSERGSSTTRHLEPAAARLVLTAEGSETLTIAGNEVPALRLGARITGEPPRPIAELARQMPVDASGARTFELLVSETAPHHVLLVRAGDRELRAYPEGDPAFPDAAAAEWLVDVNLHGVEWEMRPPSEPTDPGEPLY